MFDLRLFRKPTFVGGSITAFAINGTIFAMFLYLTLYLQTAHSSRRWERVCGWRSSRSR